LIPRVLIAATVHVIWIAAAGAMAAEARHPDCEPAAPHPEFLKLSGDEARQIIADHFSQESPGEPLAFAGLAYACVTRSHSSDMREVAVFARNDGGDVRLYISGEAAAVRLQDAINRLIHDAHRPKSTPRPVQVKGHVKKPGKVPFHEGMTVAEAIEKAGGVAKPGATRLHVVRRVDGKKVRTSAEPAHKIQPDDTIEVSE
jgi:hypothetical protein